MLASKTREENKEGKTCIVLGTHVKTDKINESGHCT